MTQADRFNDGELVWRRLYSKIIEFWFVNDEFFLAMLILIGFLLVFSLGGCKDPHEGQICTKWMPNGDHTAGIVTQDCVEWRSDGLK